MHNWANKMWLLVIACPIIGMQVLERAISKNILMQREDMEKSIMNELLKGKLPDGGRSYKVWRGAASFLEPVFSAASAGVQINEQVRQLPDFRIQQKTTDTISPRMVAYEKAIDNARALKKAGAYALARIEYDRALRLNTESAPEIQKEKEELPQGENDNGMYTNDEVEAVIIPGSPQWQYDSVITIATRHFADRRFDSAIVNYRLAGQILPEQIFPGNQIRAIEWELAQIWKGYVSARTEKLSREVRAALAQKKYADALPGLYELMQYNPRDEWVKTQFSNVRRLLSNQGVDTDSVLALVKLPDVWDVMAQNKPDLPTAELTDSLKSEAPGSYRSGGVMETALKTKPIAANFIQTEAIPYPPARLAELFPGIDFKKLPPGQALNLIDGPDEHFAVTKRAQSMKPSLQLSDSAGNIKVTCEGMYFSGLNMYLKIRISNSSVSDFPVGAMLLDWKQKGRRRLERIPVSVSDHPIVQSGRYFSLIYVCRVGYISDDEEIYFSLEGRMGSRKWKIEIPGTIYNQEKSKKENQL